MATPKKKQSQKRQSAKPIFADPIVIGISNTSNKEKKISLFGPPSKYERNKDTSVIIKNKGGDIDFLYEDILWQISFAPIFIGKIHFYIVKGDVSKITKGVARLFIQRNYIGGSFLNQSIPGTLLKPEQYQTIAYETNLMAFGSVGIHSGDTISFSLPAQSEITLTIYPLAISVNNKYVFDQVKNILNFYSSTINYQRTCFDATVKEILQQKEKALSSAADKLSKMSDIVEEQEVILSETKASLAKTVVQLKKLQPIPSVAKKKK